MSLPRAITSPELAKLRSENQFSRVHFAIYKPNVIYTARVNGAPASNDMVREIAFDGGSGTLEDVRAEMLLWVGSTAGAKDIGICRIRKAPDSDTFYFSPTSEIVWVDNAYLTVVDMSLLAAKPVLIDDGDMLMDGEHAFDDQYDDFDPVPVIDCHAVGTLADGSLDLQFDASDSYVFGSSIVSYAWEAPGSLSIDDDTSATPIITYDTAGNHPVYCMVTAANGKSATGIRYAFRFDADHPPLAGMLVGDPTVDVDRGGWSFSLRMIADADPTEVIENALCVLIADDWYGYVKGSLGPLENRENIAAWGWIADESIDWDAEAGTVDFTVQGPHDWLKQINTNLVELNLAVDTPSTWLTMPALTVDRALWFTLHWRSNATALLSVYLTGDARLAPNLKTMAGSLLAQMNEIAWKKIYARIGCDRYGRFWAFIDPQMVPEADRDWATVMTLTKKDWKERININRSTRKKLSIFASSGWIVDASGNVNTVYSLSFGHIHARTGTSEIIDQVLVEDQEQANEQAGLYTGWKNPELEFDTIMLAQNNRFIDVFPAQFLAITVEEGDTVRGIAYEGNLIPRAITLRYDPEAMCFNTEVDVEPETFAAPAVNGDPPPSSGWDAVDLSIPNLDIGMPDFGNLGEILTLPASVENPNQPKTVIIGTSLGVFYTQNFDEDVPTWAAMNNGFPSADRSKIYKMIVTPSGSIWMLCRDSTFDEGIIYFTAGLGGTWTEYARGSDFEDGAGNIIALGYNPYEYEKISMAVSSSTDAHFMIGDRNGVVIGVALWIHPGFSGDIVFLHGNWFLVASHGGVFSTPKAWKFPYSGASSEDAFIGGSDAVPRFLRALPTNMLIYPGGGNDVDYLETDLTYSSPGVFFPSPSMQAIAVSPTGAIMLGANGSTFFETYKSTDGGASWSDISGVIPAGSDVWENCRDDNRFIFGGGTIIRLTLDAGDTYLDKMGNLAYLAPLVDIQHIRFIA